MLKHILDALQGCFGPREKRTENALIPNDSQVWSASIVKRDASETNLRGRVPHGEPLPTVVVGDSPDRESAMVRTWSELPPRPSPGQPGRGAKSPCIYWLRWPRTAGVAASEALKGRCSTD